MPDDRGDNAPSRVPTCSRPETDGVPRLLLSVDEASRSLGVGLTTMYELLAANAFPVMRIGRRVLVPVKGLEDWIAAHSEGPGLHRMATGAAEPAGNGQKSCTCGGYTDRSGAAR